MNKDAAIIIAVFVITTALYYTGILDVILTGLASGISLSVTPVADGQIVIQHPSSINIGQRINIFTIFFNTGSTTYEERIEARITDVNFTILDTYFDGYRTLKPGESRAFNLTYYPNTTGFYWINVKVPFAGKTAEKWSLFYVFPPAPVFVFQPSAPSGTTTERIQTTQPGPLITDIGLDYQKKIVLLRGQSYLIPVTVKNLGTSYAVNVALLTDYKLPVVDVTPKLFPEISPESSAIFLISTTVPIGFPLGEHDIEFTIRFNNITSSPYRVSIDVRESDIHNETYQMLQNYMYLARMVEREIIIASFQGKNVSSAEYNLALADEIILDAIELFNSDKYEEAKSRLLESKPYLEAAILELAKANILPASLRLPAYLPLVFLLIILIVMPLGIILFWKFHIKGLAAPQNKA